MLLSVYSTRQDIGPGEGRGRAAGAGEWAPMRTHVGRAALHTPTLSLFPLFSFGWQPCES